MRLKGLKQLGVPWPRAFPSGVLSEVGTSRSWDRASPDPVVEVAAVLSVRGAVEPLFIGQCNSATDVEGGGHIPGFGGRSAAWGGAQRVAGSETTLLRDGPGRHHGEYPMAGRGRGQSQQLPGMKEMEAGWEEMQGEGSVCHKVSGACSGTLKWKRLGDDAVKRRARSFGVLWGMSSKEGSLWLRDQQHGMSGALSSTEKSVPLLSPHRMEGGGFGEGGGEGVYPGVGELTCIHAFCQWCLLERLQSTGHGPPHPGAWPRSRGSCGLQQPPPCRPTTGG